MPRDCICRSLLLWNSSNRTTGCCSVYIRGPLKSHSISHPFGAQRTWFVSGCVVPADVRSRTWPFSGPGRKTPWTALRPGMGPVGFARPPPLTLPGVSLLLIATVWNWWEQPRARPSGERGCCVGGHHVWRPSLIPPSTGHLLLSPCGDVKGSLHKGFAHTKISENQNERVP